MTVPQQENYMFLDKYSSNEHDFYIYETDSLNSEDWGEPDLIGFTRKTSSDPSLSEDPFWNPFFGPEGKTKVNKPIGFNPNCILPAFGENTPPFHKVSVLPRRAKYNSRDYIKENSIKDRFIEEKFNNWRNGGDGSDIYSDVNTWTSGHPHAIFTSISSSLELGEFLYPYIAFKNYQIDPEHHYHVGKIRQQFGGANLTASGPSYTRWFSPEIPKFFYSPTNEIDNTITITSNPDSWGSTSYLFTSSNKSSTPFFGDFQYDDYKRNYVLNPAGAERKDIANITKRLLPADSFDSNIESMIFDGTTEKFMTKDQFNQILYYDGSHFYSMPLYGLDSQGRVFKVRKRYFGSTREEIERDGYSGLAYFSSIDDTFGAPIGLWQGSETSPLFARTANGWAFYSMGIECPPAEDEYIINSVYKGVKAEDEEFLEASVLVSSNNYNLFYNGKSIVVPRSLNTKLGVNVTATITETGEELNQTLLTPDIVTDDTLPPLAARVPPSLINDDISIEIDFNHPISNYSYLFDKVLHNGESFNGAWKQYLPPGADNSYWLRTPKQSTSFGLEPFANGSHILNVDESPENILNPAGRDYISYIEFYTTKTADLWDFTSSESIFGIYNPNSDFSLSFFDGGARHRMQVRENASSDTIASTRTVPALRGFVEFCYNKTNTLGNDPSTGLELNDTMRVAFDKAGPGVLTDSNPANQIYVVGNPYIHPETVQFIQNVTSFEYVGEKVTRNYFSGSVFKDFINHYLDPVTSENARDHWGGCKLEAVYVLENEFGRNEYPIKSLETFNYLHYMNTIDEIPSGYCEPGPTSSMSGDFGDRVTCFDVQVGKNPSYYFNWIAGNWAGWPIEYHRLTLILDDETELVGKWSIPPVPRSASVGPYDEEIFEEGFTIDSAHENKQIINIKIESSPVSDPSSAFPDPQEYQKYVRVNILTQSDFCINRSVDPPGVESEQRTCGQTILPA